MKHFRFLRYILGICTLCLLLSGAKAQEPKYLALTFDDGPSGKFTRRLLDGLEERGAKATFFLCGYRVEQYPDLPGEILGRGHEIGLHGYSHDPMGSMSASALNRELEETDRLLFEAAGQHFSLLRPPGGQCTDGVAQAAQAHGLSLVLWSVDPRDWARHDAAAVAEQVVREARDGDIILLHDMWDSSVDAALDIVSRLQAEGYAFVTVSELAALRGANLTPGESYYCLGN